MKMFVTGAGGMVGSYVPDVFRDVELVLTDIVDGIESLDITDARSVNDAIARAKPDVVLHLAAATDVDRCELEPEWAPRADALGTEHGVRARREPRATLVYISTGAVSPADKDEPYTETDTPGPVNVY